MTTINPYFIRKNRKFRFINLFFQCLLVLALSGCGAAPKFTVSVEKGGMVGVLDENVAKDSCDDECVYTASKSGANITLVAFPPDGSEVTQWQGKSKQIEECGSQLVCSFKIEEAENVKPLFKRKINIRESNFEILDSDLNKICFAYEDECSNPAASNEEFCQSLDILCDHFDMTDSDDTNYFKDHPNCDDDVWDLCDSFQNRIDFAFNEIMERAPTEAESDAWYNDLHNDKTCKDLIDTLSSNANKPPANFYRICGPSNDIGVVFL